MTWFEIDRKGLAAILERRGKFFALAELISNAWDSNTKDVSIQLTPVNGQPLATLEVEDKGEGFQNLDDAFTMFAPSRRAGNATQRGRFNLGEKLVLSVCRHASITTTGGVIIFQEDGGRLRGRSERTRGTLFAATIKMTRAEYEEVCASMRRLLPPVPTYFNGQLLECPKLICRFETKLPTEIADAEGQLRRSVRLAEVEVYECETGTGEVLELGIPVVETENGYIVNVNQKIPLNMERDNVTPAFLKALNVALLNAVHDKLSEEAAALPWAQEAAGDARASVEAVGSCIVKRFGDKAVIANPSDPMANATAAAAGYTVVSGGSLSAGAWANVRKTNALLSASKVFVTPKPEQVAKAAEQSCPLCGR